MFIIVYNSKFQYLKQITTCYTPKLQSTEHPKAAVNIFSIPRGGDPPQNFGKKKLDHIGRSDARAGSSARRTIGALEGA